MHCKSIVITLALLAGFASLTPAARAQEELIPIDQSVRQPYVIKHSGHYVLQHDLINLSGTAITIQANEVTLDLDGHRIIGPNSLDGVGIAIMNATNVEVRNGHLGRLGIGVEAIGSTNVVVEDLQIDGVDAGGTPPDVEIGIMVINSRGCRITNNVITETFLGIFMRGDGSGGNRVTDNVITGGDNGELAICYNPAPGGSGGPDGDLVARNLISRFRRGMSFSEGSVGNVAHDNTIAYFDIGVQEAVAGNNLIDNNDLVQISR